MEGKLAIRVLINEVSVIHSFIQSLTRSFSRSLVHSFILAVMGDAKHFAVFVGCFSRNPSQQIHVLM